MARPYTDPVEILTEPVPAQAPFFILFGGVPLLFLSALTFHVPAEVDAGTKLLYAYLTYAILGLSYSLVNIPYGSLASAMTQSVHQRPSSSLRGSSAALSAASSSPTSSRRRSPTSAARRRR